MTIKKRSGLSKREFLSGAGIAIALSATASLSKKVKAAKRLPLVPSSEPKLARLTLVNVNPRIATPSESYVTFGMAFKKGDVSSTKIPWIRHAETKVELPAQFDLRSTWRDGSLRWCEVSMVAPSITAGGRLNIELYAKTGSYNNTPTRTVTDITGSHDIKVSITECITFDGSTYMGGAQEASFIKAVANYDASLHQFKLVKSGPICDQWRAWMFFPGQGARTSAQLAAWFYVTAWTKQSDGTLGPISHITKVHNGWMNQTSPTKYIYKASYLNGASVVRRFDSDKNFSIVTGTRITCTAHGRQNGDPVLVSGSTLPTAFVAGTVYYVRVIDANTLQLHTTGPLAQANQSALSTAGGSGTNTLQFRICHHHHSSWWSTDTDGLSDWTSNEATIVVQQDKQYLRSTAMVPPYDLSISANPALDTTPTQYTPLSLGDISGSIDTAGSSTHRGYIAQWCIYALLTQEKGYIQTARANALAMTGQPHQFINEATGRITAYRGTSATGASGNYPGLGTISLTAMYFSETQYVDVAAPTGGLGPWQPTGTNNWSHQPECIYYTLLTEGGCHLLDALIVITNAALLGLLGGAFGTTGSSGVSQVRVSRKTSGDPYYYALLCTSPIERAIGWRIRSWGFCAAIIPDSWDEKQYFLDVLSTTATYAKDLISIFNAGFQNTGTWDFNQGWGWSDPWMHSWICTSAAHAYRMHEIAEMGLWVDHLKKLPLGFANGSFPCPLGVKGMSISNSLAAKAVNSYYDWPDVGVTYSDGTGSLTGEAVTATGAPGTGTFTRSLSADVTQWDLTAGDKIMWTSTGPGGSSQIALIPGEITPDAWYHVINPSGSSGQNLTFQVATTPGGSPINISSDGGRVGVAWRPAVCPSTYFRAKTTDTAYNQVVASVAYMIACGITGLDTAYDTYHALQGANFSADPAWAISPKRF